MSTDRDQLLDLLRTLSFEERDVTLASGKKSRFYVDCKQTALHPLGQVLIGRLVLKEIQDSGLDITAVGGLTLGADPISTAVALTSSLVDRPIPSFIVRKEPKGHGTGAYIEGSKNLREGTAVCVVEDVITTGGSAIKAITRVRDAGYQVPLVIALVDREEGGREAIEAEGVQVRSLFRRSDFLTTPSDA